MQFALGLREMTLVCYTGLKEELCWPYSTVFKPNHIGNKRKYHGGMLLTRGLFTNSWIIKKCKWQSVNAGQKRDDRRISNFKVVVLMAIAANLDYGPSRDSLCICLKWPCHNQWVPFFQFQVPNLSVNKANKHVKSSSCTLDFPRPDYPSHHRSWHGHSTSTCLSGLMTGTSLIVNSKP